MTNDNESESDSSRARARDLDAQLDKYADLPPLPSYDRDHYDDDGHHADTGYYGVMYAGDYKWDNVRCTREAYGDTDASGLSSIRRGFKRRSLAFHSTWMDVATAKKCVDYIGAYNAFDPAYVADALDELPTPSAVVVGREGSPVIYVWTTEPRDAMAAFEAIDDKAAAAAEETMKELGRDPKMGRSKIRGPDELGGIVDADSYPVWKVGHPLETMPSDKATLIRAWWD